MVGDGDGEVGNGEGDPGLWVGAGDGELECPVGAWDGCDGGGCRTGSTPTGAGDSPRTLGCTWATCRFALPFLDGTGEAREALGDGLDRVPVATSAAGLPGSAAGAVAFL